MSASAYNITLSLNLTSIFNLPVRILGRMRKVNDLLVAATTSQMHLNDVILDSALPSLESEITTASAVPSAQATVMVQKAPNFQPFPGPWGFFTSGYTLGLFLMAVLLHRIQNIVVPPRELAFNQFRRHSSDNTISHGHSLVRKLYARLLPLDLSKTSTRLVFHLPSLYLLSKMLLLWTLILLQTSSILNLPSNGQFDSSLPGEFSPLMTINSWQWVRRLSIWSSGFEMEDICWKTFCSVCAAFCVEALVKGLDGAGLGLATHMNANTSPFNLVGYAFLLHIYSSPSTHPNKSQSLPSRPDKHVVVTIAIPLLQLTIFHILSIRKKWSHHRLLPTALSSFLSLTHFHFTLWSHARSPSASASSSSSSSSSSDRESISRIENLHYQLYQPPHAMYPLLNYIPNIFETLLLLTTFVTIALNALTQLLLTGRADRPLVGLGLGGGSSPGHGPISLPYEEDFGVLLLRVGTASLEATGLRGWGNEVGGVVAPPGTHDGPAPREEKVYGSIGIGRAGVTWMQNGFTIPGPTSERVRRRRIGVGKGRVGGDVNRRAPNLPMTYQRGWENEVRTVSSGSVSPARYGLSSPTASPPAWWVPGIGLGAGGIAGDWRWYVELLRFFWGVFAVCKGVTLGLWMILRGRRTAVAGIADESKIDDFPEADVWGSQWSPRGSDLEDAEDLYDRFLRGDIDDDEDDDPDWAPDVAEDVQFSEDDEMDSSDMNERTQEVAMLYSDWARARSPGTNIVSSRMSSPSPASTSEFSEIFSPSQPATTRNIGVAPVLLAHMTHSSTSPLTRRRYTSLLQGGSPHFDGVPIRRREGQASSATDESRRNCVVCTVEARQIICWPCRCLALCDECRESLASRSAASKHRCPCCRRIVEGYSRIFIP